MSQPVPRHAPALYLATAARGVSAVRPPADIVKACAFVDSTKTFARVVYRLVDGKAVATPVRVGPSDLTHTVILEGLEAGERVVRNVQWAALSRQGTRSVPTYGGARKGPRRTHCPESC